MRDHLVDVHHVGVLVMHVEQIDLVRQHAAVEAAFLDHDDVEAVGIGIDRRGPHAARRALAADDHGLDAELRQMRHQRRAVEARGALLGDDDVARLRLELGLDLVERRILRHALALGRGDARRQAVGPRVLGGVEDRDAGGAGGGEQPLGRLDRRIGVLAAGARIGLVQLRHRLWPALIGQLVEIDREQRWRGADEGLADVMGVDVQHVRRDDVLPAVVFEVVGHGALPLATSGRPVEACSLSGSEPRHNLT